MTLDEKQSRVWAGAFFGVCAALAWIIYANTGLRFTYAPLNYITFIALVLALPGTLIGLAIWTNRRWVRWPAVGLLILLALPVLLCVMVETSSLIATTFDGKDPSFEKIGELNGPLWQYRVYRADGGAATSVGLVLRREHAVVPGIVFVSKIRSFYPASDMRLEKLPNGMARMTVAPYDQGDTVKTYDFKP